MKTRAYQSAEALRRKHVPDPAAELLDDLRASLEVADSHSERQALVDAAMDAADALTGDNGAYAELHAQIDAVANPPADPGVWDGSFVNPETGERGRFVDPQVLAAENPLFATVLDSVAKAETAGEVDQRVAAALGSDVEWSDGEVLALMSVVDNLVDDGTIVSAAERDHADAAEKFAQAWQDQEEAAAARQPPTLLADAMAEEVTA